MTRILVIAAILGLAAVAQAQDLPPVHRMKVIAAPKPATPALRGPEAAAPPIAVRLPANVYAAAPNDPAACRATCARSYYFCLSSGADASCPDKWVACRAGCASPTPAVR